MTVSGYNLEASHGRQIADISQELLLHVGLKKAHICVGYSTHIYRHIVTNVNSWLSFNQEGHVGVVRILHKVHVVMYYSCACTCVPLSSYINTLIHVYTCILHVYTGTYMHNYKNVCRT